MSNVLLRLKATPGQARIRLKATPRQARLRHSQFEDLRRIGNYVAKPAFFTITSGLLVLTPNPER